LDFINVDDQGFRHRQGISGYGAHGYCAGDLDYFKSMIKESTEAAITDFLQANFDLGDGE
jgi:hypothetical protein